MRGYHVVFSLVFLKIKEYFSNSFQGRWALMHTKSDWTKHKKSHKISKVQFSDCLNLLSFKLSFLFRDLTRVWTQNSCLVVSHSYHYTRIVSVLVWDCNWILFMHGLFCPFRLIHNLFILKKKHWNVTLKLDIPFNSSMVFACCWTVSFNCCSCCTRFCTIPLVIKPSGK